jgi:hypothetical protein
VPQNTETTHICGREEARFAIDFMDKVHKNLNKAIITKLGEIDYLQESSTKEKLEQVEEEISDWSFVLEWLPQLNLNDSCVIECYKYGDSDFRYYMKIHNKEEFEKYCSEDEKKNTSMFMTMKKLPLIGNNNEQFVWEHIQVPLTKEGVWQAFMLYELWRMLPLGWHYNYAKEIYYLRQEDMEKIKKSVWRLTEQQGELMDMLNEKKSRLLLPRVEIDEAHNRAAIYYTFWNDWKGLVAAKLPIVYEQGSIRWGERKERVLVPYNCGIMF